MKPQTVATILAVLSVVSFASATDYCKIKPDHIGCNHSGKFAATCPSDAAMIPIGQAEKDIFLNAHNDYRNKIAGGGIAGFPSAQDMNFVQWDDELASLAALNVRQCAMNHDKSRATDAFPYAGQNLYYGGSLPDFPEVKATLADSVVSWTDESKDATLASITACCGGGQPGKVIGHFTQVVRSNVVRIGCAASKYTAKYKNILVACNYSYTNMVGTPVYLAGTAGAACKKGKHATYKNLCL